MSRPSGVPVVPEETAGVAVYLAEIESRGRLNILPRWRKRVRWLAAVAGDVQSLMTLVEPGLIRISEWAKDGVRVEARFRELSASADPDAPDALRLIQARFQKLAIPARDRPSLGDAALAHLGIGIERKQNTLVYVSVFSEYLELMSQEFRNKLLIRGHPLLEDLP